MEFNTREKYKDHDRDDPDYYGIRDIEVLIGEIDEEDYYKTIKIYSTFKVNYKKYESRGDRNKNLSAKQYLYKMRPYLRDMINERKAAIKLKNNKTQSGEWEIQLSMHVNLISSKDTWKTRTIYVWSDNAEIMMGNRINDIIEELFKSFLDNYQKEE